MSWDRRAKVAYMPLGHAIMNSVDGGEKRGSSGIRMGVSGCPGVEGRGLRIRPSFV